MNQKIINECKSRIDKNNEKCRKIRDFFIYLHKYTTETQFIYQKISIVFEQKEIYHFLKRKKILTTSKTNIIIDSEKLSEYIKFLGDKNHGYKRIIIQLNKNKPIKSNMTIYQDYLDLKRKISNEKIF